MRSRTEILPGIVLTVALTFAGRTGAVPAPEGLTTEYRTNPVGLDCDAPRLAWRMPSAAAGFTPAAAHVLAASSAEGLARGEGDLWDAETRDFGAVYRGKALSTGQRVWWKVKIVDTDGRTSDWSAPATWTMGVTDPADWRARWIGASRDAVFRKRFAVRPGLRRATLFITGLGFYEATLNGRRIGRKVLDPAPTDYNRRVLYSTYLVEDGLHPGDNTLGVTVGHGWYDMRTVSAWDFGKAPWRGKPRMIAQLHLAYADGSSETIVSDETWRAGPSPILYDCLREGEIQGPVPAWPEESAVPATAPKGRLVAEGQPGAEVVRTLRPRAVVPVSNGVWRVEFPENFAGWVRLNVRGAKAGDRIRLQYDEQLSGREKAIGQFFWASGSRAVVPDGAFQTDHFISSGRPVETFEPHFTYHGFQFVTITGLRTAPKPEDVTGCLVRTAYPETWRFDSSDPTLNALMTAAARSYAANFTDGVPTDCPQREKNGWTGDAALAVELAQYVGDNTPAYEKWIADLCDAQLPDGDLPCIVPTSGWGSDHAGGPVWGSALALIPWTLYRDRGDRRALDLAYPALQRFCDYHLGRTRDDWCGHGLGDWVPVKSKTGTGVTSTAYLYRCLVILADTAELKGLADDAARYRDRAARVRAAFRRLMLKPDGTVDNGTQTAQAIALVFGLVEDSERDAVRAKLVAAVEASGGHADFGILGATHVFRALSEAGRTDLAYRMLVRPDAPSFGEWIARGATTLWENWEGTTSRNHIMFGGYFAWAYRHLAGIRPREGGDGFREPLIAPETPPGLDWIDASAETPYGRIRSAWKRVAGGTTFEIDVPVGVTARVRLPGRAETRVGAGHHVFPAQEPLAVRTGADGLSLEVRDARTGRTWRPAAPTSGAARLDWKLDAAGTEIACTVTAAPGCTNVLAVPAPFATRRGDRLIVPMNEGVGLPVDEENPGLRPFPAWQGHGGLSMPFFGVEDPRDGSGWMAILETPDDATMDAVRGTDGLWHVGPRWDLTCGTFGYARKIRYIFFARGGYVAFAKRYRRQARAEGKLVTFREKARTRPAVDRLPGAVNIWSWDNPWKIIGDLRAAGVKRILWSHGGDDGLVRWIVSFPDMLASRYDLYQDVYHPEQLKRLGAVEPEQITNADAWPADVARFGSGPDDWSRAWGVKGADGTWTWCAAMCDVCAPWRARGRLADELAHRPYNARFTDCVTATAWRECRHPAHPTTRSRSRAARTELLRLQAEEFGLVVGSETGLDAVLPWCDYFEGMMSLTEYRVPDAGRDIARVWNDVPDLVARYQVGPRYRLPLWELVYHDCCAAHWYWGDYQNKLPAVWRKRDLFNVLYGTVPMFLVDAGQVAALKDRIVESCRLTQPVARATGFSEMTDHRFLSPDGSRQETRFADGTRVTVDFAQDKVEVRLGREGMR